MLRLCLLNDIIKSFEAQQRDEIACLFLLFIALAG